MRKLGLAIALALPLAPALAVEYEYKNAPEYRRFHLDVIPDYRRLFVISQNLDWIVLDSRRPRVQGFLSEFARQDTHRSILGRCDEVRRTADKVVNRVVAYTGHLPERVEMLTRTKEVVQKCHDLLDQF